MNKKNMLSLALSLAALALAAPQAAGAPKGQQERPRASANARKQAKPSKKEQEATYTCPMHHDVHSKTPGECPKCGMDLELEKPVKAKSE